MTIDRPVETRKGEELNLENLNKYFGQVAPRVGLVVGQQQFPGGYSNLTYLLTTDRGEFILRRPPFGAAIKSAHDMGREFKVLSLLEGHYPKIPTPIVFCEDTEIIGSPFYIMQRIRGVILRPSDKNLSIAPDEMRKISEALVDNLVELHSLDITTTGLIQLGKPEGYIQRQVEGWTKRYAAAQTDSITAMESLSTWLAQNQPADASPTLLHNDYKYDNLVLNENDLSEIIGVLDWEMATVGDPWMDVGASLAYWAQDGEGDLAKVFNISWLPGNLTRKEVVERYTEKSGRSVKNPVFYYVFGLYKNAVIAQQIYARWKQGHSKDSRFGSLIHVIRDLGMSGLKAVEMNCV